jgi:pimeloyl-ACP methyl ester carboxylesterase
MFDFPGCGNSQGTFVTYGITEKYDVDSILNMIDQTFGYEEYNIWGRSMGAVVSIFYAQLYLSLKSYKQFEEKFDNKKKLIRRKTSVYKTQYRKNKDGKTIKQVLRMDYDEHGILIPKKKIPKAYWKNKVRALILDSPFTNLFTMIQSKIYPLYLNLRHAQKSQ